MTTEPESGGMTREREAELREWHHGSSDGMVRELLDALDATRKLLDAAQQDWDALEKSYATAIDACTLTEKERDAARREAEEATALLSEGFIQGGGAWRASVVLHMDKHGRPLTQALATDEPEAPAPGGGEGGNWHGRYMAHQSNALAGHCCLIEDCEFCDVNRRAPAPAEEKPVSVYCGECRGHFLPPHEHEEAKRE